jgi:hypothetical protein
MFAKILAGVVVAFGVTGMGLYFANSKSSCSPCGSSSRQVQVLSDNVTSPADPECCYLGSPCCSSDDCCLKQAPVAVSKAGCCDAGKCCEAESASK